MITSVLNSDNPHVFFTIKEMVNAFSSIDKQFDWHIYVSNNCPSKQYLNDAINTFRKTNIKIIKEEVNIQKYVDIYQIVVDKTRNYDYVMQVDLN